MEQQNMLVNIPRSRSLPDIRKLGHDAPETWHPIPPEHHTVTILPFLEQELDECIRSDCKGVSMQKYMAINSAIYKYMTSPRFGISSRPASEINGEELYTWLDNYVVRYLERTRKASQDLDGEDLLNFFVLEWARYQRVASFIDRLFGYLQRHYIDVSIAQGRQNIYDLPTLHLIRWKGEMFDFLHDTAFNEVLELTRKQRSGEWVRVSDIRQFMDSFVSLGRGTEEGSSLGLDLYKSRFEALFCQASIEYYSRMSTLFLDDHGIAEYMTWAESRLRQEESRAPLYLIGEIVGPLMQACEQALVVEHADKIRDEFIPLLQSNSKKDLSRMYRLLTRIPNSLDPLRPRFEHYLRESWLDSVNSLVNGAGTMDWIIYVDTLSNLISSSSYLVAEIFNNDSAFKNSWARACREMVNWNKACKSDSKRAAEILAIWTNEYISRNASSSAADEEAFKEMLNSIITILEHIVDKDIFQKLYTRMLAKRLLSVNSSCTDFEASMVPALRGVCGAKFANALHRMIRDLQVSREVQVSYKSWQSENSAATVLCDDCDTSYKILYSDFWPLNVQTSAFAPPKQISEKCNHFEEFFRQKYQGRRLTWLWNMSKAELKANYLNGPANIPYIFQLSAFQMTILLLFNNKELISYMEIESSTRLDREILDSCINSLIKAKVIIAQSSDGESDSSSQYRLNYGFKYKRGKVPLHMAIKSGRKREAEKIHTAQKEERRFIIQCAVIRVMKSRKKMKYVELVAETIQQIQTCFSPSFADVKKYVEVLLEKEFLERLPDDGIGYLA